MVGSPCSVSNTSLFSVTRNPHFSGWKRVLSDLRGPCVIGGASTTPCGSSPVSVCASDVLCGSWTPSRSTLLPLFLLETRSFSKKINFWLQTLCCQMGSKHSIPSFPWGTLHALDGFWEIVYRSLNVNFTSPNFEIRHYGTPPIHISYGVFSTALDGTRLSLNMAASKAYPQKDRGRPAWLIIDRTISNRVRFPSRKHHPYGISEGASRETISRLLKWSTNSWLKYSSSRSDRRTLIFLSS